MLFDYCIMGHVFDQKMKSKQLRKESNSITDSEYFLISTGLCLTFKDITGVDTQDTEYKVILSYINLQMSI